MSEWPPTLQALFEREEGDATSIFSQKLWAQLSIRVPSFESLPETDKQSIFSLALELNQYASAANNRLQDSPFTTRERRFFAPPSGAGEGQKYNKWKRDHEDQCCIDACALALAAVLQGDFVTAARHALSAGTSAHGHLAVVARPVLDHVTKRGSRRGRSKKLLQRDEEILEAAANIRRKNSTLADNDSAVAKLIVKKDNFLHNKVSERTIRDILSRARKLAT
ncbi:MAG: hypothetical protein ISS15_20160 [Alphaproteobacteria bacterium]|nr:hypothetical protein [Alphaproteobacteria bacterium]